MVYISCVHSVYYKEFHYVITEALKKEEHFTSPLPFTQRNAWSI
jgi:hypothetical protein